jgi:hypothetical protein
MWEKVVQHQKGFILNLPPFMPLASNKPHTQTQQNPMQYGE